MPTWQVTEPEINLWLRDTPLYYRPSRGPAIAFTLLYKDQPEDRDSFSRYDTNVFSFGWQWHSAWRSYIEVTSTNDATAWVYTSDGRAISFTVGGAREQNTLAFLVFTNAQYVLTYRNGAIDRFGQDTSGSFGGNSVRRFFLTSREDPFGIATTFSYSTNSGVVKLTKVVDADLGETTIAYYGSTNPVFNALVWKVTDRFGRIAELKYSTNGCLTNIIDVANIDSRLAYDADRNVTNLVTPYGATSFRFFMPLTTSPAYRSLQITEPNGAKHLYLAATSLSTSLVSASYPDVPVTTGVGFSFANTFNNGDLNTYNTFYWGPRQYSVLSASVQSALTSGTTNWMDNLISSDTKAGRMRHWLRTQVGFSQVLALERLPSPDGVEDGLKTWYDHLAKSGTFNEIVGTNVWPTFVANSITASESRFQRLTYNQTGFPLQRVDTYTAADSTWKVRTNAFTYSSDGTALITHTDPAGFLVTSNGYAAGTRLLTESYDALTNRTLLTYNAKSQLTGVRFPTGLVRSNYFYSSGTYSNWLQKRVEFEDNAGTLLALRTNEFTFLTGQLYTHRDARDLTVTNLWDGLGRLLGQIFPDGTTTTNRYTILSGAGYAGGSGSLNILDPTAIKDRAGNWTYFNYDSTRNLLAVTNALTNATLYSWCSCGSLESVQSPTGESVSYFYDRQGRLTNSIYSGGASFTNFLNVRGQLVQTADAVGTTGFLYGNQGLLLTASTPDGRISATAYDLLDRPSLSTNNQGVVFTFQYDAKGRLKSRAKSGSGTEIYSYSVRGLTNYANGLGTNTSFVLDALGRRTLITNAVQEGVKFEYTPAGDLYRITDGKLQTTRFGYDQYGRLTNKLDHTSTEVLRLAYDVVGRMTNRVEYGKQTILTYDAVGNLKNLDYADATPDVAVLYDKANRPTNLVSSVATISWAYTNGLLSLEDGPWADDTVLYGYNQARLRSSMTVQQPNAAPWAESRIYDATHRLGTITAPSGAFTYNYAAASAKPRRLLHPSGGYITNVFDTAGRLSSTELRSSLHSILNSHAYLYDNADRPYRQTRTDGSYVEYQYDAVGQLRTATAKESGGVIVRTNEIFGYSYDKAHNLSSRTNDALVISLSSESRNRLQSFSRSGTVTVSGTTASAATNVTVNGTPAFRYADATFARGGFSLVDGTNSFTATAQDALGRSSSDTVNIWLPASPSFVYDAAGNLSSDGRRGFEYDAENRLIRVTVTNSWKTELAYDGLSRMRTRREFQWRGGGWTQSTEVRYLYDGRLVVQERDGSNVPLNSYTRGLDRASSRQRAGGIGGLLALTRFDTPSPSHSFYHADAMGNITALVNPEQSIVAKYLYDPYGGLLAQSGPLADFNSQRFSSKEHLKDAGLYQFGYRLYDPSLQRWLTRDPLGEVVGGYNLYAFAGNSPTRLLDAFGLDDSTGDPDLDARTSDPLPTPLSPYLPCIETAPWAEGLGYMGDALTDPDKWTDALEAIPTLPTLAIASGIHAAQGEFGDALFDAVGAALGLLGGSGGSAGAGMADDVAAAAGRMATTEAAESGLSAAARSAEGAAVASKVAEKGGLNLFRSGQEGLATRGAATGWKDGDRMFHLPNQGSPKANWKQNSGRLREEMGRGEPIFDSFRDPSTGLQIPSGLTPGSGGRFLNAERKLLESRGWKYSPSTGAYHPPSP